MSLADYRAAQALRGESFASLIIAAVQRSHADDGVRLVRAFWDLFGDRDDFEHQMAARVPDATVGALLMAAYSKADNDNERTLSGLFPLLCAETARRWNAPGGRLDDDPGGAR